MPWTGRFALQLSSEGVHHLPCPCPAPRISLPENLSLRARAHPHRVSTTASHAPASAILAPVPHLPFLCCRALPSSDARHPRSMLSLESRAPAFRNLRPRSRLLLPHARSHPRHGHVSRRDPAPAPPSSPPAPLSVGGRVTTAPALASAIHGRPRPETCPHLSRSPPHPGAPTTPLHGAQVVEVSTSKTGKHGHAKCHFVAIDIFNGKKLEDIVPSSHNCDIPHVNRTEYQLIDISEDGFVSLLTSDGNTKDDLRLPTDETLVAQAYLLAMLALVIVLFYFTIFAFIVTHRGYQELGQD
uniref:Translation initiation factor 5A C-terminal domain-containing protein n=1 Tax=Zea mays TaxID=4577 RepID=A0A804P9H1_MAIZE